MSGAAIRVEHLSKRYRIGRRSTGQLREALTHAAQRFGRLLARPWSRCAGSDDGRDEFWALDDISFEVTEGEALGVIGCNGAGKSTLLKILSRITEPTLGRITIRGRVASLLEVGTGFHPELTGRENVYLAGAILGMTKAEIRSRFDEIVAFAEVDKFLDTPVKRYSSGMHTRLAFAVAAHLEPDILIVDEVLAVGDVAFQKKSLGRMRDARAQGRTVVFVSHHMPAVRHLCPRAILLRDGKIVSSGPTPGVVDDYLQLAADTGDALDVDALIAALPADPAIRLRNVSLYQDGSARTHFATDRPIEVIVEYDVLAGTHGLRLSLLLTDTEDVGLFRSFSHSDGSELPYLAPGRYVSRATIPGDLLAPIPYRLAIGAAVENVRHCFDGQAVRIPISAADTGRVRNAYAQSGRIGVRLAPHIPWTTEVDAHAHSCAGA
ncbi:MAG: ABC transporter ATP-binding protein [Phycisphaerae bacterium]